MPLVDKKDQAERWGPDKNKSLILYATSKEKKEANPKLPDFQGYVSDSSGNIYRAVGWRKKSQNGTDMDKQIFVSACNFIGVLNEKKDTWNKFKKSKLKITEDEIKQKIDERNDARKNKDYKLADKIRNDLADKGVSIEDKDDKTLWKFR